MNIKMFEDASRRLTRNYSDIFGTDRNRLSYQEAQDKLAHILFGYRDYHELKERKPDLFVERAPAMRNPVSTIQTITSQERTGPVKMALIGQPGCGKTMIAQHIAAQAMKNGFKVRILAKRIGYQEFAKENNTEIRTSRVNDQLMFSNSLEQYKNEWMSDNPIMLFNVEPDEREMSRGITSKIDLSTFTLPPKTILICDGIERVENIPLDNAEMVIVVERYMDDAAKVIPAPFDISFFYRKSAGAWDATFSQDARVQAIANSLPFEQYDKTRSVSPYQPAAIRVKGSFVLGIVGPEGSGKTYTANELIKHLVNSYSIGVVNGESSKDRILLRDVAPMDLKYQINIFDKFYDSQIPSLTFFKSIGSGTQDLSDDGLATLENKSRCIIYDVPDEKSDRHFHADMENTLVILTGSDAQEMWHHADAIIRFIDFKWYLRIKKNTESRHLMTLMRSNFIRAIQRVDRDI